MRFEIIEYLATDEHGDRYTTFLPTPVVNFRPVPEKLTRQLLNFVQTKNLGKSITIDGTEYTLDYISESHRKTSRGLSIYFRVERSILRISDHWSQTAGNPRSRKLNCGRIDTAYWALDNHPASQPLTFTWHAGKYPWRVMAGKAGLSILNKSVTHWKH